MPPLSSTIFNQLSLCIIEEQALIIGPIAWEEAKKVPGITIIDQKGGQVYLEGDGKEILNNLVAQYARLFGKTSKEVCKEAAKDLLKSIQESDIPSSLR
jgi:hypothetical protein